MAMCNNPSKEEEYIDYSCSTSVERLTRDVESILRSWHVHDGADRHFSVSANSDGITLLRSERLTWVATLPDRQSIRLELELALWDGPASRAPSPRNNSERRRLSSTSASAVGSRGGLFKGVLGKGKRRKKRKKGDRRSSLSNDECLKKTMRDMKEATAAFSDELEGSSHTICTDLFDEDEVVEDSDNCEGKQWHLPKSLRRPHHPHDVTHIPESLFDNFSSLFGVGQHLVLTPSNPQLILGISEGSDDDGQSNDPLILQLYKVLLGRHETTEARRVLTQLLTAWLQTALNNAAMNCQCCLPVFGVWGHYPCESLWNKQDVEDDDDESASRVSSTSSPNFDLCPGSSDVTSRASIRAFPPWMDGANTLKWPLQRHTSSAISPEWPVRRTIPAKLIDTGIGQEPKSNMSFIPPLVNGTVVPIADTYAQFTCSILPETLLSGSVDRLSTWGDLLSRYCSQASPSNDASVVLCGARHVYSWSKEMAPKDQAESWRGLDPKSYWKQQQKHSNPAMEHMYHWRDSSLPVPPSSTLKEEVEDYKHACRAKALELLERVYGTESWGPREDPISSVRVSSLWKSKNVPPEEDSRENQLTTVQALGSFPSPTNHDSLLSSTVLDPAGCSSFRLKAFLDHQALEPTLATSQRCLLACLIRTSTLAPLTLLRHLLWEEDIVDDWDHEAGDQAALEIASEARVGEATRTLVAVMDWATCAEEMIGTEQAEKIVKEVLEGTASFGFPSPPDDMFALEHQQGLYTQDGLSLLEPLFHSAPIGRLLSDLCARMAQLRTPCSMALVWSTFCHELRHRWDSREPLPHMTYIPGLDPLPSILSQRQRLSTIGLKADLSAFLNCSEPDPDDQHCLLGQKLQVFNVGIEAMTAIEAERERFFEEERPYDATPRRDMNSPISECCEEINDDCNSSIPARATSLVSLVSEGMNASPPNSEPSLKPIASNRIVNLSSLGSFQLPADLFKGRSRKVALMEGLLPKDPSPAQDPEDEVSIASPTRSMASEFFDAEECGMSVFSSASLLSTNLTASVVQRIDRKGARCPLRGCSLVASGDQVYAPYLQRPEPLTGDMIVHRRMMLAEDKLPSETNNLSDERSPIQKRLEIAYRLQKPKLLSDMNSFKAANPGAIFQDFINWYGNPGNPLDEYSWRDKPENTDEGREQQTFHNGLANRASVAATIGKATEAIHILNETRNFWSSTWDEATATPASDQNPLFDVFSTVEMTLDYLENMHPAILLNQVLAVNLANAYFVLVSSAKDAINVKVVESSIRRLRERTEEALDMLRDEASNATTTFFDMQGSCSGKAEPNFISIKTLHACEQVCSALSETEIITSLATSLLQKLPGQHGNVESILRHSDGADVDFPEMQGRLEALAFMRKQQGGDKDFAEPLLQEYMLRNLDDANPCQLSVRYCDAGNSGGGKTSSEKGGLMIAVTRTIRED